MFNKTIFKQTFKSNLKIWLIITFVLSAFNAVMIAVFEPSTISSLSNMVKDTPLSSMLSDTSFLGMLSQTFYSLHAIILPLIFIIIVANNLVVSQVDRGSMAYILSTPIKRIEVVSTQAIYLVSSIFVMLLINTSVGLVAVQGFHGGVWGENYTKDVKAAAKVLELDKDEVKSDLNLILDNKEALKAGAEARKVDEDVYTAYLNLKIADKANEKAQESQLATEMQEKIFAGINAAAKELDVESSEVTSDMSLIKSDDKALDAAVKESGLPEDVFVAIVDNQIASGLVSADEGMDFDVNAYITLNGGLFLLMFATSGVAFMFSCIFNLSKYYMAFGAGIPVAFFLFDMMTQVSENLDIVKYFTLNTLFDTDAIISGGEYMMNFVILGFIGIVLYGIGMYVFRRKDLPL